MLHRPRRLGAPCPAARFGRAPLVATLLFATLGLLPGTPTPARAAPNDQARLAIHLTTVTSKAVCTRSAASPPCAATVTSGALYPTTYFAYLLVQNGDATAGISGLQCGINYNAAPRAGVDIYSWTNCATLEFPSGGWPAANSGNLITWDNTTRCQRNEPGGAGTGVVAPAGYFYLAAYSPDVLVIIPRPIDGVARVADCANVESTLEGGGVHHNPSYLGAAAFSAGGTTPGHNPCTASTGEPIDCTITGPPAIVLGSTGNSYSASAAPAAATFAWTISGNATISGSRTLRSVSVSGGPAGSFELAVAVSSGGNTATCSRTLAVDPGPPQTCDISGPGPVVERTGGHTYRISASAAIVSVAWSIAGNGTIVGSSTGTSVVITAGAPGAFDLTANVQLTLGRSTACTRTITVTPEPPLTCVLTGPTTVDQHTASLTYSVATSYPVVDYQWSISGNGTISSSTTGAVVQVTSGPPGSFQLRCDPISAGGSTTFCSRAVSVQATTPPGCSINGPNPVVEGVAGLLYGATTSIQATGYNWSVSGQAVITSSTTESTVLVTAGAPGAFELRLDYQTLAGRVATCVRTVTVVPSSGLSCTIDGPGEVGEGVLGLRYTATLPLTPSSYLWSITGNGSITTPVTGSTVLVASGPAGAFELTLNYTALGGSTGRCVRTVTVTAGPAPTCVINGSSPVIAGTPGLGYSASTSIGASSYLWSITGNGTISSSPTASTVQVTAGAAGAFDLRLDFTVAGGAPGSCTRTVTVNPAPPFSCTITGPTPVTEGAQGLAYQLNATGALTGVSWSLAGNGSIVSSTNTAQVLIDAGEPGAFVLTATVQPATGGPVTCLKGVTVSPIVCTINGPSSVVNALPSIPYTSVGLLSGATYLWAVSGNASIVGSNSGPEVFVTSGAPGSFELTLQLSRSGRMEACSRTVSVSGTGGAGSNANASLVLHATPSTMTTPCTRTAARPTCNAVSYNNLSLFPATYFVYLLVQDASWNVGVAGLQCGIEYNAAPNAGVDVDGWTSCATLDFPSTGWPSSGGGNLITWDSATQCQRTVPPGNDALNGVVAAAGYFYLTAHTPDVMSLIPRPVDGRATIADCQAVEDLIGGIGFPAERPSRLGRAAFGQNGGYNPCGYALPRRSTTWSVIKAQYGTLESGVRRN